MRRVMIACVTFETYKISEPVEYYGANVVYLIHHVDEPSPDNIYSEFFERTCQLIRDAVPGAEIHGLDRKVTDYADVLRTINAVVHEELMNDSELMVNLSAGSPEFISAATTASMMEPSLKAFFVRASEYTVSDDKVREIYYQDGHPVGLVRGVRSVVDMPEFKVEMPDELLVRALRLYIDATDHHRIFSSMFVKELKGAGLWARVGETDLGISEEKRMNNEKVFFQRRYIDEWKKRGWIEKSGTSYVVTEKGRTIASVLYPDEEDLRS